VSPLFRRNAPPVDVPEPDVPDERPTGRAQTAGKGRPTPKRKDALKRRAEPPPKSNKEARARMREKSREERQERLDGMRRGDDRYLLARDRGPAKRLVRDIIDSRRNVGPLFFMGVLVVVVFSSAQWPAQVRVGATFLWLVLIVMLIMDAVVIGLRVRKLIHERLPDAQTKMRGLIGYAVLRSVSFRKIRNPAPQVKPGDPI
jgi:hypothetical protein